MLKKSAHVDATFFAGVVIKGGRLEFVCEGEVQSDHAETISAALLSLSQAVRAEARDGLFKP